MCCVYYSTLRLLPVPAINIVQGYQPKRHRTTVKAAYSDIDESFILTGGVKRGRGCDALRYLALFRVAHVYVCATIVIFLNRNSNAERESVVV